jgi:F-type H+-transporting ATPase subunit epsilon
VRILQEDGAEQVIAVHQGFVEVSPPDADGATRVTILSDVAELADTIDVNRAKAARDRAIHRLAGDSNDEDAKAALARAEVRLEVAGAPKSGTTHDNH